MEGGRGHPMCILPGLALVSSFQLDPKYIFHLRNSQWSSVLLTIFNTWNSIDMLAYGLSLFATV